MVSELVIAAGELLLRAIVNKAANEKVQKAIIVVVEPNRAGSPARRGQAGFFCDVGKCPVAIVLI